MLILFASIFASTASLVATLNLTSMILSMYRSNPLESNVETVEPRQNAAYKIYYFYGDILPFLKGLQNLRNIQVKDDEPPGTNRAQYDSYAPNKADQPFSKNRLSKPSKIINYLLDASSRRHKRETQQNETKSTPPDSDTTLEEKSYFGRHYGNYYMRNKFRRSRKYFGQKPRNYGLTSYSGLHAPIAYSQPADHYGLTSYSGPTGIYASTPYSGQPADNYAPTSYYGQPADRYMATSYYSLHPGSYAPAYYHQNGGSYQTNDNHGWATTYFGQQPGYYRSTNYYGQHSGHYGPTSYYGQQTGKYIPAQVYSNKPVPLAKSTIESSKEPGDDNEDEELCVVFNGTKTGQHKLENNKLWNPIKLLKGRSGELKINEKNI